MKFTPSPWPPCWPPPRRARRHSADQAHAQAASFTLSSPDLAGQRVPAPSSSSTASAAAAATPRRRWCGATCLRGRNRSRCRCTTPMRRPAAASGTGPSTTCRRAPPAWRKARATPRGRCLRGPMAATPTSSTPVRPAATATTAGRVRRRRPAASLRVHALRARGRQGRGGRRHPEDRHGGALQLRDEQGRRPGAARQGVVHRDLRR